MRLTNGTDTVNLTNQIQIRAYLTSGYYVADGEPTADEPEETAETVEETKKPTRKNAVRNKRQRARRLVVFFD